MTGKDLRIVFMGTPEFAEFWHLLNTSYHCLGRGSEVSLIKLDGVIPLEVNELTCRCHILAIQLQRQKSGPFQTLPIHPHRDGILKDFHFSLIHLIVVSGCCHDCVSPIFSKAALNTKKSGESDSVMSKRWTKLLGEIWTASEALADEINKELGSHSNRKGVKSGDG